MVRTMLSMVTFWFPKVKDETGKDLSMSHTLVWVWKKVYKQTNLVKGIYMYKITHQGPVLVGKLYKYIR